jgi:hypothetical protein
MTRTKKVLFVVSVMFSTEFLCLPLLTSGTFSSTVQRVPPVLKAASHRNANTFKSRSPAKTDGSSVLEVSDEQTPRPAGFLTTKANGEFHVKRSVAAPHRFRTILAPKVSRYIAKSVLNI